MTPSNPNISAVAAKKITRTVQIFTRRRSRLLALSCLLLIAFAAKTSASKKDNPPQATVELQDAKGVHIASGNSSTQQPMQNSANLVVDRQFQPGDHIVFTGPQRMALQVSGNIPECLIFMPDSAKSTSYVIPYGKEEKDTGSAYDPQSFSGTSHQFSVRPLMKKELRAYRNLALNPCDAQTAENEPANFFPHASTNSVSRSLFDFAARNAIDGVSNNGHHGVWPYQSWGPQLRTDLWWKLDFGRPVELDKIRLMVRADFPHDSFWKTADIEFSDGTKISINIQQSAEFQDFPFPKRKISWIRITNLVPADPQRWCSFIEVQAWGKDLS